MRRTILTSMSAVAVALTAACVSDAPTGPMTGSRAVADRGYGLQLPGSQLTGMMTTGQATPINCMPKNPAYGAAVIGPSGGDLIIGSHRLIVPPGALDSNVTISGTVPSDKPFEINLEPHGLHFKKAAGLILDATSCTNVPDIVYLIDQYTVSAPIVATYSTFWHTIACPIWHFSGYSVAFFEDDSESIAR